MKFEFKTISSKELFRNPYWNYYLDRYSINDQEFDYHYVNSRGSVIIIPKLDDTKFLMVEQYRYLNKKNSIEFPGGGVKLNSNYEITAINELEEETGYTTHNLEFIGEFNPCNGITNEICRVYLATNLEKIKSQSEETEKIQLLTLTLEEINQLIKSNKIWDSMSITSLYFYVSKFTNKL